MDLEQIKDEIASLISRKIDLEQLKAKIDNLKEHFLEIDPEKVQKLNHKLNSGLEYQQSVVQIIEALKENDLSGKDIDKISDLIHKAKAVNIDFPELRSLESIKYIPSWIKKLCLVILPKKTQQKQMEKRNILDLSKELIHQVDLIDPISIQSKLKQGLKENTQEGKTPLVLDKTLTELNIKIKLILWIREAFEILGKDKFTNKEINELKDSQLKDVKLEKFKLLKYKYQNFKEHVDEIYQLKNEWLEKSTQLIEKVEQTEIGTYDEDGSISQLREELEHHLKKASEKIEKIQEVKEIFQQIKLNLEKVDWSMTVQEMVKNKEKKNIIDLQLLYKKAMDLEISRNWKVFEGFEELYNITQNIALATEQISKHRNLIKKSKYDPEQSLHNFFQNNMTKINFKDALQIKEQIALLEDKINIQEEMEEMNKDLEACKNFETNVNEFILKYKEILDKDESEITKEEFAEIETDMHNLNEKLFQIPIYLGEKEPDLFLFEWSIISVQFLSGYKKKSQEEWEQLLVATNIMTNPSEVLIQRIASEISHYMKIQEAVSELKKKENLSQIERQEQASELRTYDEVQNLLKALQNCLIDCESETLYIKNLLDMVDQKLKKYQEDTKGQDKIYRKIYKENLKNIRESLPFTVNEEFEIQEILKEAENITEQLKNLPAKKNAQWELVSRYRIQKVMIKEADKLSKEFKIIEEKIEKIEQQLEQQELEKLAMKEPIEAHKKCIELQKDLENLHGDIKQDRYNQCQNELFVTKINILETLWEKEEEVDCKFKEIYNLYKEADQLREKEIEKNKKKMEQEEISDNDFNSQQYQKYLSKLEKSVIFLKKVVQTCEKKLKQFREIQNLKQLENIIKNESHCFCGFISLKQEIKTHKESLEKSQTREKQLKNKQKKYQKSINSSLQSPFNSESSSSESESDSSDSETDQKAKKLKNKKQLEKNKKMAIETKSKRIHRVASTTPKKQSEILQQKLERKIRIQQRKEKQENKSDKINISNIFEDSIEHEISKLDQLEKELEEEKVEEPKTHSKTQPQPQPQAQKSKKPSQNQKSTKDFLEEKERAMQRELKRLEFRHQQKEEMARRKERDNYEKKKRIEQLKQKIEIMKKKELLAQQLKEKQKRKIKQKKLLALQQQKEEERKKKVIKQKLVGQISQVLTNIKYLSLSIDESLVYAKKIFKQIILIEEETSDELNFKKVEKKIKEVCQIFYNVSIYKSICEHLKNKKFSYTLLQTLANKPDSYLEQENKQLEINYQLNKQEKEIGGMKISKISKKTNQNQNSLFQQNPLQSLSLTSIRQNNNLNQNQNSLQQQQYQLSQQQNTSHKSLQENLEFRKQQFLAKKSIQKLQAKKSTTKNFGSYTSQSAVKSQNQNFNNNEAQFSDNEQNSADFENQEFLNQNQGEQLMTEEDYQQFYEIMKKEKEKYENKISKIPVMYNPEKDSQFQQQNQLIPFNNEENSVLNNSQNQGKIQNHQQLQQQQKNQDEQEEEDDDYTSYQIASLDFDSENYYFDQVKIMSMHSLQDLEKLPNNTISPLKINGKLQEIQVQEHFLNIFQQQVISPKEITFCAGWFESLKSEQQEALNEYALFLLSQKKIAVIEWAKECKLYVLHTNQIPQEWFDQANFAVLSEINQTCHLQFFCMYKEYKAPKTDKKVSIIKIHNENQNLTQNNSIELQNNLNPQNQTNNQQLDYQQFLKNMPQNNQNQPKAKELEVEILEALLNPEAHQEKIQEQIEKIQKIQQEAQNSQKTKLDYFIQRKLKQQFGIPYKKHQRYNPNYPQKHNQLQNQNQNVPNFLQSLDINKINNKQQQQQQQQQFGQQYNKLHQNNQVKNVFSASKKSANKFYNQNNQQQVYQEDQNTDEEILNMLNQYNTQPNKNLNLNQNQNQNNNIKIQEDYEQFDDEFEDIQKQNQIQNQQLNNFNNQYQYQQQQQFLTDNEDEEEENYNQLNLQQQQQQQLQQLQQFSHKKPQPFSGKKSEAKRNFSQYQNPQNNFQQISQAQSNYKGKNFDPNYHLKKQKFSTQKFQNNNSKPHQIHQNQQNSQNQQPQFQLDQIQSQLQQLQNFQNLPQQQLQFNQDSFDSNSQNEEDFDLQKQIAQQKEEIEMLRLQQQALKNKKTMEKLQTQIAKKSASKKSTAKFNNKQQSRQQQQQNLDYQYQYNYQSQQPYQQQAYNQNQSLNQNQNQISYQNNYQSNQKQKQQQQQQQQYQQKQQAHIIQEQQKNTNQTFLRTRDNSFDSNTSKSKNIFPINNPNLQMNKQNNRMKNSFMMENDKTNEGVNQERLRMFRI